MAIQPRRRRTEGEIRHVARSRALVDLADMHPQDFQILLAARTQQLRKEQAEGRPPSVMGRRPKHRNDGRECCTECGERYPCQTALRRKEFQE